MELNLFPIAIFIQLNVLPLGNAQLEIISASRDVLWIFSCLLIRYLRVSVNITVIKF